MLNQYELNKTLSEGIIRTDKKIIAIIAYSIFMSSSGVQKKFGRRHKLLQNGNKSE